MPLQEICVSPKDPVVQNPAAPTKETQMVRVVSPTFSPMDRCASQTSTLSSGHDICRICHCEAEPDAPLIAPCYCSGSLRYVHQACLQQWIKSSDTRSCELCKFHFIMHTKSKPFRKWEKLDMAAVERRKVCCSVAFHLVAITCVVWSLYVLIERTADEVRLGVLEWPFWTKLVVVAVGFTGGLVFMYIQCKMYVHLCRRWRAFNRVIYVQNAPEKAPPPPPLPYKLADKQAMVAAAAAAAALPQPDPAQTFPVTRPWSQSAVTPMATAAVTPAPSPTPQTDSAIADNQPAEPGIT